MDTMICNCDLDVNCGNHQDEYTYWAEYFGGTRLPVAYDPADAYEPNDYKGRYAMGWDAS